MGENPRRVPRWLIYFEGVCLVALVAGLIVETITGAPVGHIIISSGSLGIVLASVLIAKVLMRG